MLLSGGAAGALLLGVCICGPFVCYSNKERSSKSVTTPVIVLVVWAQLSVGTVVVGGLMLKIGQSFSTDEELATDVPLN